MISLVVMNFGRPNYLKKVILPHFNKMEIIDEILVSHGKEETYFELPLPKIKNLKHWDLNATYGLSLRFLTASQAKNDTILIIDDDIYAPEKTIQFLYEKLHDSPNTIHGIYGRNLNENKEYNYKLIAGNCHIVLTRLMMLKKELCLYFLENMRGIENTMIKNSKPYWNGEDITMSLLSIKKTGEYPQAYRLPHKNKLHLFELNTGISTGNTHLNYRKELCKYLIEKLEIESEIKNLSPTQYQASSNAFYEVKNSSYYIYILLLLIPVILTWLSSFF